MKPPEQPAWPVIEAILREALDHDPHSRDAFVAAKCAGDERLAHEVQTLLRAARAAEDSEFLEDHATLIADLDVLPSPLLAPGDLVGPFRLVREIGRGGMGVVFLAERADGHFEQRVAVKVLARSGSRETRARFLRERQIVARLEHPGIARLIDGGLTDDGAPYFAMEYVEGEPITDYADAKRLSVDERLQLFLQACDAVHEAHRNLIVHRDIKPTNILVDATGAVRLLDFGIAKLLHDEAPGTSDAPTTLWMTPAYAAPEQLKGESITTATDVWALGAVLHELLTGRRLRDVDPSKPAALIEQALSDKQSRPSVAVGEQTQIAMLRAMTPDALRRRLRGDLDTIVAHATALDPTMRYASAAALSADVRRHLEGDAIEARGPSFAYRAGKFAGRHRAGVALGSLAIVALVAGLIATAWQAEVATRERHRAERSAQDARRVKDALLEVFALADPNQAPGATINARDLVSRGARTVVERLGDQPLVQAETLSALARMQRSLGLYDDAEALVTRALALRREILGDRHELVASSLGDLAALDFEAGRFESSETRAREALALQRERYGATHADIAQSLHQIGIAQAGQGRYAEAEATLLEALAMRRELFGNDHAEVARTSGQLSIVVRSLDRFDEAEAYAREAFEIARARFGPKHTEVADHERQLALVLWDQGRFDEALAGLRAVIATRRALEGPEHPRVVEAMADMTGVLRQSGRQDEAERTAREVLDIVTRTRGDDHPDVADALHRLAMLAYDRGDLDASFAGFNEARLRYLDAYGPNHPATLTAAGNLGAVLRDLGRYGEAERVLREVVDVRRTHFGDEHRKVATAWYNLAALLQLKGDFEEAEKLHRDVLATRVRLLGPDHPTLTWSLNDLGAICLASGRAAEAAAFYRESLRIARLAYQPDHPRRAIPLLGLAKVAANSSAVARDEGRAVAAEALAILEKARSADADDARAVLATLGG